MDVQQFLTYGTQDALPPHAGQRILQAGAPLDRAKGVVILLHGRGASPEDIIGLATELQAPQLCFLAPAAAANSWYPQSFLAGESINGAHVASAHSVIEALFDQLGKHGLGPERCVLGGFSQGACLSLDHAFRFPRRYGLILAYTWTNKAYSYGDASTLSCKSFHKLNNVIILNTIPLRYGLIVYRFLQLKKKSHLIPFSYLLCSLYINFWRC